MPSYPDDFEIREFIADDRDEFIRQLSATDAFRSKLHLHHSEAVRLHSLAFGIDKQTRQEQSQAAFDSKPDNSAAIAEITKDPAFGNRLDSRHKQVMEKYRELFK